MDEPRHPRLYRRLKNSFGPTYLTVLSIIQGVALTDLAAVVAAEHARFTLVTWLLSLINFGVLIVTWNVYAQQSVMWTWIPDLRDSTIPFVVGATELFLNHALAESLTAWLLGLAAFAFVSVVATLYITRRASEEPENAALFDVVRAHHLRFSLYLGATGVLLVILALISIKTGAGSEAWGRGERGVIALLLALATGASFTLALYFAQGLQRKTVAFARTGRPPAKRRWRTAREIPHGQQPPGDGALPISRADSGQGHTMEKAMRVALTVGGLLALICAAGFAARTGWATSLWPWPDGIVPYLFLGAVAAAIGAGSLWIALAGELGATVGGCVTLTVFYAALAISLGVQAARGGPAGIGTAAPVCALGAIAFVGALAYVARVRRYPIRDTRPLPPLARWSFYVYVGLLGVVGLALLFGLPNTFPWALKPTTSALIGSFFVGAAGFFAYALRRQAWGNAAAQLWAFLAYDVVLIVPYVAHFSNVAPAHLPALIVNVSVLIYSGGLSVYFLLLDSGTRSLGRAISPRRWRPAGTEQVRQPAEVAAPRQ